MIKCIRLLPAAVAGCALLGALPMPWGFVSPSAYLRVHVTLMGQVELCRGGAKCSRAPTLETMSCVSRGLAYERHTYVFSEVTRW